MKNQLTLDFESCGKISIEKEYQDGKHQWSFHVFHYLEPMKNYVYIATAINKNFNLGLEGAIKFLDSDLYYEIFIDQNE
jgi:hypothetical protein